MLTLRAGIPGREGRDPRAAGVEIIGILQARRDSGEPATIGKEEESRPSSRAVASHGLGIGSRATEKRPSALTVRSAWFASLGSAWIARID
jgi:hypothetical protein